MMVSNRRSPLFVDLAIVVAIAAGVCTAEAHKPITSKYTYNDDVFPIFRDKCSRCHVDGGVAPMSLMTYNEAFQWAESIRIELVAAHMPPWNAQAGFGALKHRQVLTAKELDTVLTWATGGNPPGQLGQHVPHVTLTHDWTIGPPDLKLVLPEFTVAADTMEQTQEFTVETGATERRPVRAVDLLPGTPSMVRSAVIAVNGERGTAFGPEQVLARWLPGQDLESVDHDGAAFTLPANAELTVRIHYKKTWQFEGKSLKDKSTVGIYFAPEKSVQDLLVVPIAAPTGAAPAGQKLTFVHVIDRDAQALALSPDQVPPNITLTASAILPNGTRTPLIRLKTRADWARRYWFEKPITMPRGTKIEIVADLEDPDQLAFAAFGGFTTSNPPAWPLEVRLSLDIIPLPTKLTAR
jgi:hypothetical protein